MYKRQIQYRREKYLESHKLLLTSPDSASRFFRNVKDYNSAEKPEIWDIKSVRPELNDEELARELSLYFNAISNEFSPLTSDQIPKTYGRKLPQLRPYQVAARIKGIRKPRSKIQGDVFPSLLTEFADLFALPLSDIYNTITDTLVWPAVWKIEIVTVIPKCNNAKAFEELRNISCTMMVNEIYESFLLRWIRDCLLYTSPSPRD